MRIPKSLSTFSFQSYFHYGKCDQDADDALPTFDDPHYRYGNHFFGFYLLFADRTWTDGNL